MFSVYKKLFNYMELRKFIKTTIREYLNEQQETENNLNENIAIDDYVSIKLINKIPKGETFHDRMNQEYYKKLSDYIRENGIQEPIILQYYFKDNAINLIEGHHRLKIANELGINKIPVKIMVIWNQNIKSDEIIFNPPKKLDVEEYVKRNYYPTFIKPSELGLF